MNAKKYYQEWFQKEYPTQTVTSSGSESRIAALRTIPFFRAIKGMFNHRIKTTVKSLLGYKMLFGYPVSPFEKEVAATYVSYILEHNPTFDENMFEEGSIEEIQYILDTQFYFVHMDRIPWKKLYSGMHWAEFDRAQKFHQKEIRHVREYYTYNGFKTVVPNFEYSVLVNKCGTGYLPGSVKDNLAGTTIIDCGAFSGDSAYVLSDFKPSEIMTFEPDPENWKVLHKNIELNNMKNIVPVKAGVGDKQETLRFNSTGICAHISEEGDSEIEITTIDTLKAQAKSRIGLIKMDIEGYEMPALRGAESVIKQDKPVLLIALYHSGRDFFEIPAMVKQMNPEYQFKIVSLNPLAPLYEKYLIAY